MCLQISQVVLWSDDFEAFWIESLADFLEQPVTARKASNEYHMLGYPISLDSKVVDEKLTVKGLCASFRCSRTALTTQLIEGSKN